MHAETVDRQEADAPRIGRPRDVVHEQTAALRDSDPIGVLLVVREQEIAGQLHLVGVRSLRDGDLPEHARVREIGDVDDARPNAEVAHVADVEDVAAPHDLHAIALAAEVGVADEFEAVRLERAGERAHLLILARFDEGWLWG
jgi:hypothetical protein